MRELIEDDEERYQEQFARYIKLNIEPDSVEEMYEKAHEAIREDPSPKPTAKKTGQEYKKLASKHTKKALNYKQRKDKIKQKKSTFHKRIAVEA
jgi:large subunit ribosomal protein L5e